MGKFEGKVAVITGGASGIGLAVAHAFQEQGARVAVADISREGCEAACKVIGGNSFPVWVDVRDQPSVEAMAAQVVAKAGGIDILVNSAGVFGLQPLLEVTPEEFDRVIAINLRGTVFATAAAARQMIAAGKGGAIVNFASSAGRRGVALAAAYCASKAGVISFTQTAAQELIGHGIRVNAIAPGAVLTPMWAEVGPAYDRLGRGTPEQVDAGIIATTPAGRLSTPADYLGAVLFLAGAASEYVVGQTLSVDGGLMMV